MKIPSHSPPDESGSLVPARPVPSWLMKGVDWAVGFQERRRSGPPSSRAWEEMLTYYAGLYQDRGPHPRQFKRLLRRCGIPQVANPFPEGEPQHFLYHPDLLIMADLEAILDDLVLEWDEQNKPPRSVESPAGTPEGNDEWPDVDRAMRLRELELQQQSREWSRLAGGCWAMGLLDGQPLSGVVERVHRANLGLATLHVWRTSPLSEWGINGENVLKAALKHGILPANVVEETLASAQGTPQHD